MPACFLDSQGSADPDVRELVSTDETLSGSLLKVLPRYLLMTRPKKDQPIFPDGHRFSIDMNAMANAEMEGNPQVQPSPGSDYVAKIVPRKFQSLSNVDVSKISGQ